MHLQCLHTCVEEEEKEEEEEERKKGGGGERFENSALSFQLSNIH